MKRFLYIFCYLFSVHLLGICFFTIFRLVLYYVNVGYAADVESKLPLLAQALLKGLQFDNFMASYITLLPLLVLTIVAFFSKIPNRLIIGCNIFFSILYFLAFIIAIADIPYFSYFFAHIGVSAFGWFQFGEETAGLIFQDISNYPYFVLLLVSITLFSFCIGRFGKQLQQSLVKVREKPNLKWALPFVVLLYGLCFLGMRGTLQRYPLRVGFAYFSNHSFFNQLGVNPVFFLMKNSIEQQKQRNNNVNDQMTMREAVELAQSELCVYSAPDDSPLYREITNISNGQKPSNVVIVLLESMAPEYLKCEYNGKSLTPYLNHLISKSYYFENFYSAGVHTNNGIVSTLYGYPALFNKPSINSEMRYSGGLPIVLRKNGYQTMFFVGGNPQYDNMNSFLYENGFDRIYSQYDYPAEKIVNNFGVQDDYLLSYGLERLNEAGEKDKPFFATFLTVSNHSPYVVPEEFKDYADTDDKKMIGFVDKAIKDFMENAANQAWYNNTIFVFLGDHGKLSGFGKYDMPITYNQIPLIIYSPFLDDAPQQFAQFGGQVDVFPTVMGLLNIPYENNSFGIDLRNDRKRPCMYFVNDNQLGCINENYLYVRNLTTQTDILYDLHSDRSENIMQQESKEGEALKKYAVSMMVTADYLMKNNQTK